MAGLALALFVLIPGSARAEPEHSEPQGPAKVAFSAGFPELVDGEWGFALGGFGGIRQGEPIAHAPVIFVHGNTVDAADWYPVRDDFKAAGWTDQELWALSYNGLGGNSGTALTRTNPASDAEHQEMGWDGQVRVTNNAVNGVDLFNFVMAVRAYTGSEQFSIVSHSLGVTLARYTLKTHPDLRKDLVAFVGIAGGNHGTSLCPPGFEENLVSCGEIAKDTSWLADLNGPDGEDETYGPAKWLTIYDGSGVADPAFAGPDYAQSPRLLGAENREFAGTYHNDLRIDPAIVTTYRTFIETADGGRRASAPGSPPTVAPGPAAPTRPVHQGAFSGVGGFVAPRPAQPDAQAAPSASPRDSADDDAAQVATISVATIGRHWSGTANSVMVLLLVSGVGLLAFDRHRRRPLP
ncbi:MAG: hypothetical protein WD691_05045 [Acidimicrobiales bacterium]